MTHPLRCIGLDTAGNSFEPLLLQRGRVADGGDVVEETTFARPECVREDEQPFRGLAVVGHLPASPSSGGSSARSSSFEIHDACFSVSGCGSTAHCPMKLPPARDKGALPERDRKSTRLNSSH